MWPKHTLWCYTIWLYIRLFISDLDIWLVGMMQNNCHDREALFILNQWHQATICITTGLIHMSEQASALRFYLPVVGTLVAGRPFSVDSTLLSPVSSCFNNQCIPLPLSPNSSVEALTLSVSKFARKLTVTMCLL